MINFKTETIEKINGREIDEFFLAYEPSGEVYSGKGEIDWGLFAEKSHLKELRPDSYGDDIFKYDDGYGMQHYIGWITFKDSNEWIQRKEYDGSEWWASFEKPSLAKGSKG